MCTVYIDVQCYSGHSVAKSHSAHAQNMQLSQLLLILGATSQCAYLCVKVGSIELVQY